MYILEILNAIKKMTIKELRDVIYENYYRQTGFTKENSNYSMKHQKKKDLLSFATKLIKKFEDFYLFEEKKHKIQNR